jgi:hypothetical protein
MNFIIVGIFQIKRELILAWIREYFTLNWCTSGVTSICALRVMSAEGAAGVFTTTISQPSGIGFSTGIIGSASSGAPG